MQHLSIRNVSPDLGRALRAEQRRLGGSLNGTVLALLRRALALEAGQPYDNGLGRFAGGWSEEDLARFEKDTAFLERIDDEVWS